jgi:hypothetical protein
MPLELDQPTSDMSQSAEQPIGAHGQIDREGEMAKQDLEKISGYAQKLDDRLQDTDQLEAWVQKKIAVAAENLASVYHYLAYEMTVNEYAEYLRKNGLLSEGTNHPAVRKLMEAKAKIKELKKAQVEKQADKKVAEGSLRGGERTCTECGGTGMVYEEPMPIPDHVKGKVSKYNTMVKATRAAHKRMEEEGEMDEDSTDTKTTTKTQHGTATATFGADGKRKGVVHKDEREYSDGGDDIATNARSGKGTKSHATSQSAEEKAKRAPAQKKSKTGTWGVEGGEKFDNRPGAPAKPKKEKEVDEGAKWRDPKHKDKLYTQEPYGDDDDRYGDDDYYNPKPDDYPGAKNLKGGGEFDHNDPLRKGYGRHGTGSMNTHGKRKGMPSRDHVSSLKGSIKSAHGTHPHPNLPEAAKPSAGLSAAKKSAVVKKAKAGGDIGKPGKSFDKVAKSAGGGEKGQKIAAAAMWKNIKETTAYMAEKKAVEKKDKPMKGSKVAGEGNAYGNAVQHTEPGKEIKINGKGTGDIKRESTDFTRMQEQLARLNRSETKTPINENSEVNRLRTLTNLFKG